MNDFIKILNKYIILIIITSIFGLPWFYLKNYFFSQGMTMDNFFIDSLPSIIDYIIRFIVAFLIYKDFKKNGLDNVVLSSIIAFFYPILGIVIFAILFIDKQVRNNVVTK